MRSSNMRTLILASALIAAGPALAATIAKPVLDASQCTRDLASVDRSFAAAMIDKHSTGRWLAIAGAAAFVAWSVRSERGTVWLLSLLPNVLAKQQAKERDAYEAWFVDSDGFVTEGSSSNAWIVTKSGTVVTRSAESGILPGITRAVLTEVLAENPSHDFGKQIIPWSLDKYRVHAYLFQGYWADIGSVRSFYRANLDLLKERPPFDFYDPDFPIFTRARLLPCSRVIDSHIENALIADGCTIEKAEIRNSVVGIRAVIREGTVIEDSIIMGADFIETDSARGPIPLGIGPGCIVRGAIIDKNVRIGANCQIVNATGAQHASGEHACIRDGIIVALKNAVIPPNTVI